MAEFDAGNVAGNGTRLLRDGQHAIGWPLEELRFCSMKREISRGQAPRSILRLLRRHAAQEGPQRELLIRLFQTGNMQRNIHDMELP
jgi:hypothetical protein